MGYSTPLFSISSTSRIASATASPTSRPLTNPSAISAAPTNRSTSAAAHQPSVVLTGVEPGCRYAEVREVRPAPTNVNPARCQYVEVRHFLMARRSRSRSFLVTYVPGSSVETGISTLPRGIAMRPDFAPGSSSPSDNVQLSRSLVDDTEEDRAYRMGIATISANYEDDRVDLRRRGFRVEFDVTQDSLGDVPNDLVAARAGIEQELRSGPEEFLELLDLAGRDVDHLPVVNYRSG